jgi:hypothetical protein
MFPYISVRRNFEYFRKKLSAVFASEQRRVVGTLVVLNLPSFCIAEAFLSGSQVAVVLHPRFNRQLIFVQCFSGDMKVHCRLEVSEGAMRLWDRSFGKQTDWVGSVCFGQRAQGAPPRRGLPTKLAFHAQSFHTEGQEILPQT